MSRVHCLDCGTSVVVDPAGICPEGHLVGSAGARVASAIGSNVPHPDEPEPWVAKVEVDHEPAAEPVTRPIRPVSVPGVEVASAPPTPVDSDELLRELHSLSDLSGELTAYRPTRPAAPPTPPPASEPPPAAPTSLPTTEAPPPTAQAPPPAQAPGRPEPSPPPASPTRPATPTRPSAPPTPPPASEPPPAAAGPVVSTDADSVAELSALEAAVQALGLDDLTGGNGSRPSGPPAAPPASAAPSTSAEPSGPEPFHSIDLVSGTPGGLDRASRDGRVPDGPAPTRGRSVADEFTAEGASRFAELESLFSAPAAPSPVTSASPDPDRITPAPPEPEPITAAPSGPERTAEEAHDAGAAELPIAADAAAEIDTSQAAGIDLGSFTARGRRVGRREAAKRQRRRR